MRPPNHLAVSSAHLIRGIAVCLAHAPIPGASSHSLHEAPEGLDVVETAPLGLRARKPRSGAPPVRCFLSPARIGPMPHVAPGSASTLHRRCPFSKIGIMNDGTIVVAGATGNLGGRIARALIERRASVKALVRQGTTPDRLERLQQLGVTIASVDRKSVVARER